MTFFSDRTKAERKADKALVEVRRLWADPTTDAKDLDEAIRRRDSAWAAVQRERAKGR